MQVLLPTDAPIVMLSPLSDSTVNQTQGSIDLQQLGERLRVAYGPVQAPLPARLAELMERLARREQIKD
jgi:hypothetical protein